MNQNWYSIYYKLKKNTLIIGLILITAILGLLNFVITPSVYADSETYCTKISGSSSLQNCLVTEGFRGVSLTNFLGGGVRTSSLNFLYDTSTKKIIGTYNCSVENGILFSKDFKNVTAEPPENNCATVGLKRLGAGSTWNGSSELSLETFQTSLNPDCKTGNSVTRGKEIYIVRRCDREMYISKTSTNQEDANQKTFYIGKPELVLSEKILSATDYASLISNLDSANPDFRKTNSEWNSTTSTKSLIPNLSGGDLSKQKAKLVSGNLLDQVNKVIKTKNPNINCDYAIEDSSKTIFRCTAVLNGVKTYFDLNAEPLAENCVGFIIGKINKPDLSDVEYENKCVSDENYNSTKSNNFNKDIQGSTISEGVNNLADSDSGIFSKFIGILFNIVAAILVIIIYFIGSAAMVLLGLLSTIFIFLLSINPADPVYLDVAARPWQVLIGLANLVTLSTFMIVGIGYILNLESFKVKVQTFILNIAIFSLLLQLTLQGSALFINVANGFGDLLVASYAGLNVDGSPNKKGLVTFFSNSMNSISLIRCGEWNGDRYISKTDEDPNCSFAIDSTRNPEEAGANALDGIGEDLSEIGASIPDALNGAIDSRPVQLFVMEFIFLISVLYAIFIMFKGVTFVMFRVVGLWLLMVVSPLALGIYFSPLKTLKKYGQEWLDKFWRLSLAYPVFILGLVIISNLVFGFANALRGSLNSSQTISSLDGTSNLALGGEIAVNAQTISSSDSAIQLLIAASLVAIVAIGAFSVLLKFMETVFGALAKALLGAAKAGIAGIGNAFKGLQKGVGTIGAISRVTGKVLTSPIGGIGNIAKGIGNKFDSLGMKSLGKAFNVTGDVFKKGGNILQKPFQLADAANSTLGLVPKIIKDIVSNRKSEVAGTDALVDSLFEGLVRSTGMGDSLGASFRKFTNFRAGDLIDPEKRDQFFEQARQNIQTNSKNALPDINYTNSQQEDMAERFGEYNMENPENKKLLDQVLKNPVTAQQILNNDKFKEYISKNLDTIPNDILQSLRKEYPVGFLFGEGTPDTSPIDSLSLEDAKQVNVGALANLDEEGHRAFLSKFPELAGNGSSANGVGVNAGKAAAQQMRESMISELRDDNFSKGSAEKIYRAASSSAVTTPNVSSYEELVATIANSAIKLDKTEGPELEELSKSTVRDLSLKNVFGARNYEDYSYLLKEIGSPGVDNEEILTQVFKDLVDLKGMDQALEALESSGFGAKLVKNSDYKEAVKKKDNKTRFQMLRRAASVSAAGLKVDANAILARLENDLPAQLQINRTVAEAQKTVKIAAEIARNLADSDSVPIDAELGIYLSSFRDLESLSKDMTGYNKMAAEYAAVHLGIQEKIVRGITKDTGLRSLGVTEAEQLSYAQLVGNIASLNARNKLLDQIIHDREQEIPKQINALTTQLQQLATDLSQTTDQATKDKIQAEIDEQDQILKDLASKQSTFTAKKNDMLGELKRNEDKQNELKDKIKHMNPEIERHFGGLTIADEIKKAKEAGEKLIEQVSAQVDPLSVGAQVAKGYQDTVKEVAAAAVDRSSTVSMDPEKVKKYI